MFGEILFFLTSRWIMVVFLTDKMSKWEAFFLLYVSRFISIEVYYAIFRDLFKFIADVEFDYVQFMFFIFIALISNIFIFYYLKPFSFTTREIILYYLFTQFAVAYLDFYLFERRSLYTAQKMAIFH